MLSFVAKSINVKTKIEVKERILETRVKLASISTDIGFPAVAYRWSRQVGYVGRKYGAREMARVYMETLEERKPYQS